MSSSGGSAEHVRSDPGRPLRVATIAACPFPCPRGTPVRIARIASALAKRGHDVRVITYHLSEGEPDAGLTIHRTPRVPTYRRMHPGPSYQKLLVMDPLLAGLAWRVLRDHPVDVVHAHHFEGLIAALFAAPRGMPVVFDAHTSLGSELPNYRLGLPKAVLERLGAYLDCHVPRRADHVMAVSESLRSRLTRQCGLSPEKVTVVGNGVAWDRSPVRRRRDEGGPVVTFAGNFAPYQGIDHLLRAFHCLVRTHPHARLVLATEDPGGFATWQSMVDELGLRDRVVLRPTTFDELPGVLAAASVGVNPRTACDGVPMKILNYMAAALPIVSFEGSAKGLRHAETAWIVPDGDVESLAGAIAKLLDDPELADRLGDRAWLETRERPSWDGIAEMVEGVFGGVVSTGVARPSRL